MRAIICANWPDPSVAPFRKRIAETANSNGVLVFAPIACDEENSRDAKIARNISRTSPPVCL